MGGTFDHFHAGHEFFLTFASEIGFKLLIGISTNKMVQAKSYLSTVQPYAARVKQVKDFCDQRGIQYQIIPLDNPYGPTLDRESKVKALCVTKETERGADKINQIRAAGQLRPLPVFVANMIYDESGQELHADRIRAGQVNRTGQVYRQLFNTTLELTDIQKSALQPPLGRVLQSEQLNNLAQRLASQPSELPICVVGDHSLNYFVTNQLKYQLGVFDGLEQRQPTSSGSTNLPDSVSTVANPAGSITQDSVDALVKLLSKLNQSKTPTHLKVEGEEDLLTAALILLLPLHSLVYYGQPNQGMVEVLVTEQVKEKVFGILSKNLLSAKT
jgi:pantetheine-phosphate adenylyltransferase